MIYRFKIFEKMSVDSLTVQISEKIWKKFLENKNESSFSVDISEFNINLRSSRTNIVPINYINVNVKKNQAESDCSNFAYTYKDGFFTVISIGLLDRESDKYKTYGKIKQDIIHEIQHMVDESRKIKLNDKSRFFDPAQSRALFRTDVFGAFSNDKGNLYNAKKTIDSFLTYNGLTEQYKKLLIYLYLATDDEMASRLHELYIQSKEPGYLDYLKQKKRPIKYYKDMIQMKLDYNLFSKKEKDKISDLFQVSNIKKVEKYINNQGQKFINKAYKLASYEEPDNTVKNSY